MARKQTDVFGFDEMNKSFDKMKGKYDNLSDAMLHTMASQAAKRLRQVAPKGVDSKKPGTLKKSYRVKKPKEYKGGTVKVSRVQSGAPHSHLVEYGHEIYTAPRKTGKVTRYNALGKRVLRIKHHGRTEGRYLFDKVWKEFEHRFPMDAQKLLDELTRDMEV